MTGKVDMLKKLFVFLGALLLGAGARGGEPAGKKPGLEEVKAAVKILLSSDCSRDSLRGSKAQQVMQTALDFIAPGDYLHFYNSQWTQKKLEKFYAEFPGLYWYEAAFEKVLDEVRNETVSPGEVKLWLVYNMGYVVKTPTHCFSIDLHHRRAEELVPCLEFALVTHNHQDHYSQDFLEAMNAAGKKVYSAFFASYGGYSKEPERELRLADDLTLRIFESDHNIHLRRFVTPFEIVCGTGNDRCVIFHSGDSCDAKQLRPRSEKVDFHMVHPRVGLDVRESARDTVKPEVTLISHLLELHHNFDKWRWSFTEGYTAAEKVRSVGKKAFVPLWGEKIVWKKER